MGLATRDYCAFWIILYCGLAFLQGVVCVCDGCVTLKARLDTAVLLQCALPMSGPPPRHGPVTVRWSQPSRGAVLEMSQTGHVSFSDPRDGRVKVFPNLCRLGNCSMAIERLQKSDLGQYCCYLRNTSICSMLQVPTHAGGPGELENSTVDRWFVIGGGAGGGFFVLLIFGFCCFKFRNPDARVLDQSSTSVQRDAGSDAEEVVYENDEHDPKDMACCSATQQPLAQKPYYANQTELFKQMEKRNRRMQYENPIYANSQEQLDQI